MSTIEGPSQNEDGLLAKNTIINIAGQGLPLLFAAAAIPFVIDGLGTARFGVLTIVWVVIGYFGLFDMGISRATTKFVADMEAEGSDKLPPFIFTSLSLLVGLGCLVSTLIYFVTPWLINDILNVPPNLIGETVNAFYILCLSIPFVLGSVGARGALEARQRFALVNAVKVPASIINYLAPLLVLPFSNRLEPVVLILLTGRVATFFIYAYYSLDEITISSVSRYPVVKWIKKLLGFGAWIMVSNFISPIMVYLDRFIIGAILTMSAVAYYTTPYEVVTRLLIISGSFMGVMFPAFSVRSLLGDERLASLNKKAFRYILLVMVPITVFIILAAYPILFLWLGADFARESTTVLRILALGVLINSIAQIPFTTLQAIGRPDITAKLHMAELPVYLVLIWYLTVTFGIEGVALAWLIRVSIDSSMLYYFSNKFIPLLGTAEYRGAATFITVLLTGTIVGYIFWQISTVYATLSYALVIAGLSFYLVWRYVMQQSDRERIWSLLGELKHNRITNKNN